MVPTSEFMRDVYPVRREAMVRRVLERCSDPALAFANWMDRDMEFGCRVAEGAARLGFRVIVADGILTMEELTRSVAAHFGLDL